MVMKFFVDTTIDNEYVFRFEKISICKSKDYYFDSSYNVLCARLMGFSYPDFLLYCRAKGGTLRGRKGYCYVTFKEKKPCEEICKRLNEEVKKLSFLEKEIIE